MINRRTFLFKLPFIPHAIKALWLPLPIPQEDDAFPFMFPNSFPVKRRSNHNLLYRIFIPRTHNG